MRGLSKNSTPGKYAVVESFKQNGRDLWELAQLESQLRRLTSWRRRDSRGITALLASAKDCAERLGLEVVRGIIERAIRKPDDGRRSREVAMAIRLAIEAEIGLPLVYRVPQRQEHFVLDAPPFGGEVEAGFPKAGAYFSDAAFAAAHGRNAMAASTLMVGVETAIKSIAPMFGIDPESRDLFAQLACRAATGKSVRGAIGCAQSLRDELRNHYQHGRYINVSDRAIRSIWGATDALLRSLLKVRLEFEAALAEDALSNPNNVEAES